MHVCSGGRVEGEFWSTYVVGQSPHRVADDLKLGRQAQKVAAGFVKSGLGPDSDSQPCECRDSQYPQEKLHPEARRRRLLYRERASRRESHDRESSSLMVQTEANIFPIYIRYFYILLLEDRKKAIRKLLSHDIFFRGPTSRHSQGRSRKNRNLVATFPNGENAARSNGERVSLRSSWRMTTHGMVKRTRRNRRRRAPTQSKSCAVVNRQDDEYRRLSGDIQETYPTQTSKKRREKT